MWMIQVSEYTQATAEQVWHFYSNVAGWPQWDSELEVCTLQGPFVAGTPGTLTPKGMTALPFVLTAVDPFKSFSDETHLPGCVLKFHHTLEPTPQGLKVTHTIHLIGPAYDQYTGTIGKSIASHLPPAIKKLISLAEALTPA
ncbi:SRPBCC family protein [Deinococcus roseus]|uniref:Polyketide cyclase n=1 Tax=Deinococcus roseus TaxID=392414 RepID=A0ABQ2D1D5_9DEIO|nr:SRPBCC family protein [Deinococcus roseus]GGJ41244.1 hypothetical protein GCM10008938_29100 [Deinococcus roseus]